MGDRGPIQQDVTGLGRDGAGQDAAAGCAGLQAGAAGGVDGPRHRDRAVRRLQVDVGAARDGQGGRESRPVRCR